MTKHIRLPFKRLDIPVNEWALYQLWDVINRIDELRGRPYRFRVAFWGTKRAKPGSKLYQQVFAMAATLAERGIDVVTGGGPGVMAAANAGAQEGRKRSGSCARSFGLRIKIRNEEPNEYLDKVFHHGTFFSRLHNFITMSSVFVVFDPGIGTVLEVLVVLQLLKEGHLVDTPIILVGKKWMGFLHWIDYGMVENGCQRSKAIPMLYHVDSIEEVAPIVMATRRRFMQRQRRRERALTTAD